MSKEIVLFKNEIFGEIRTLKLDDKPYFVGKDVAEILGYANPSKAVLMHCKNGIKEVIDVTSQNGNAHNKARNTQEMTLIPEGDLYRLIIKSKLPKAQEFEEWVMDEVLPQIRQTGGYIAIKEDDSEADIMARALLIAQRTLDKKDEIIKLKENQIKQQEKEIEYKENIIIGLVDDIDLAEKRQRINQIIRKGRNGKEIANRWNSLYREFEMKYHINISKRRENYNKNNKPKITNNLAYIDKVLNKIPEMYELCCKLFENDLEKLLDEIRNTVA
ncbi:BRO-N domain-containing protein [Clostridium perfringens]|uniref:BRO-N domain-containing protein n=1 Tax=Clostridium perfringens TaxID=1502 RepID=UPI00096A8E7B|nr:BRO family protein [Clostridium perfringens]